MPIAQKATSLTRYPAIIKLKWVRGACKISRLKHKQSQHEHSPPNNRDQK